MKDVKLVILGGGSSYTPELVAGIVDRWKEDEFHASEIMLVDIPCQSRRLETVAQFVRRIIRKHNMPCKLTTTFDRRIALDGASFVISQVRVGLMKARQRDEHIPLRHGVIGQETTGAGGFANALRTIPVALEFAQDVMDICPEAWLLNFTNPSGIITEALLKHSSVRTFGLCNVPIGIKMGLAKSLGVDPERVDVDVAGLNHLSFVTRVCLDGNDLGDMVFDSPGYSQYLESIGVKQDTERLVRSQRLIPASYLYYYWQKNAAYTSLKRELDQGKGTRADQVMAIERELFQMYSDTSLEGLPALLKQRGGAHYSDAVLNCMSAMVRNVPANEALNVLNRGAVPGLPEGSVVEVSCHVDSRGPHPLAQLPLPASVLGLVQRVKAYEELTIQAAVEGNPEKGFLALLNHPLVGDADTALALMGDILEANRDYLPQFKGKRI